MAKLFEPYELKTLRLKNRIVMSPMCQYSAATDGLPSDWHLVHYASRAVGGVGLIILEATAVESRGRISAADLGLWEDRQVEPMARLVKLCHDLGAKVGVQLAHAGRKAWSSTKGQGPGQPVAPSAVPFDPSWVTPQELTPDEIGRVVAAWGQAARRARAAGFDLVEVHAAHGYLTHQFLSPLSNRRSDQYGGSRENRVRFAHRVIDAIREAWPPDRPLFVRVSASDYTPGGLDIDETVGIAHTLKAKGIDLIDTSSGGLVQANLSVYPGYQVAFAERIKREVGVPTAAVGLISQPEHAEEIVAAGRADLVFLGRELLRHPSWPLDAASALGAEVPWPEQYRRAKR